MQRRPVLLIPSDDCGWAGVRLALAAWPDLRVIGEATTAAHGVELALLLQPDIIIAAAELEGTAMLPLLSELHRTACARSTIILLASQPRPADPAAIERVEIAGYLLWSDLSTEALRYCLAAVITGDVVVISQAVATALLAERQRGSGAHSEPVPLTARKRMVLRCLAEGRTHKEIAVAEGLSPRTVERTVARLEQKLGAPTQFVLGMKAAQLGLLDP
jgi:DNA-binding NarL/FixJ family response regulator